METKSKSKSVECQVCGESFSAKGFALHALSHVKAKLTAETWSFTRLVYNYLAWFAEIICVLAVLAVMLKIAVPLVFIFFKWIFNIQIKDGPWEILKSLSSALFDFFGGL